MPITFKGPPAPAIVFLVAQGGRLETGSLDKSSLENEAVKLVL
jgi:hypothetical protein